MHVQIVQEEVMKEIVGWRLMMKTKNQEEETKQNQPQNV